MPILNLKLWISGEVGEQKNLFEPYRKPTAARTLILARSAISVRIKRPLSHKRRSHCPETVHLRVETPWKGKAEFLNDFCLRMNISGYHQQYRKAIILSQPGTRQDPVGRSIWIETTLQEQRLDVEGEQEGEGEEEERLVRRMKEARTISQYSGPFHQGGESRRGGGRE